MLMLPGSLSSTAGSFAARGSLNTLMMTLAALGGRHHSVGCRRLFARVRAGGTPGLVDCPWAGFTGVRGDANRPMQRRFHISPSPPFSRCSRDYDRTRFGRRRRADEVPRVPAVRVALDAVRLRSASRCGLGRRRLAPVARRAGLRRWYGGAHQCCASALFAALILGRATRLIGRTAVIPTTCRSPSSARGSSGSGCFVFNAGFGAWCVRHRRRSHS